CESSGIFAGAFAEYQKIGERIAAQPVGAMQAGGAFSGCEQSRHIGHLRVSVNSDAAHHVVSRRTYFHRLLGDVNIGKLLELVIHARQLLLYMFRSIREFLFDPRNIQEDSTVRTSSFFAYFAPDAAGYVVTRQQLGRTLGVLVPLRVAPAFLF